MKPIWISQDKELVSSPINQPLLQLFAITKEKVGIMFAIAGLCRSSLVKDVGSNGRELTIVGWRGALLRMLEPGSLLDHPRIAPVFMLLTIDLEEASSAVERLLRRNKGKSSEHRIFIDGDGVEG
jgi:hypothetical protein